MSTLVAVTIGHARNATISQEMLMTIGRATVDNMQFPSWLCVIGERHASTAVLSRHLGTMDHAVAREVMAQHGDQSLRLPAWSSVRNADDAELATHVVLEQAYGFPMPVFHEMSFVEAGAHADNRSTRVLLAGALFSTVFYSMAWLLLIRLPGSIRRAQHWMATTLYDGPRHVSAA